MEMQFGCVGFGLGYKKLSFGLANMVRLKIRHGFYDGNIIKLQLNDMLCVGGRSGSSLVISVFETEWFCLNGDPKANNWVYDLPRLINHKAELIATGLTAGNRLTSKLGSDKLGDAIGTNQMRFTFNTFDKHGNSTTRISNKIVPIRDGWQLSDFKVTGILQTSEI
jgi:hypothetical protein